MKSTFQGFFLAFFLLIATHVGGDTYYWDGDRKIVLIPLDVQAAGGIEKITHYRTASGAVVGVSNQLILKLADNQNIEPYLQKFQLSLARQLGERLYVLSTGNHMDAIEVSKEIACEYGVEYAQPDFISRPELR